MSEHPPAGAVLTGGASRRMGRDKALVEVDGVPMAGRAAAALVGAGCSPVVAVGGDAGALGAVGLVSIPDLWPGEGPLGGIVTALRHTGVATVVVATDLPFLDAGTLEMLIAADLRLADVVVARAERREPLCALWRPSALVVLERLFAEGTRAVHRAISALRAGEVAVAPARLFNVNRPDDLAVDVRVRPDPLGEDAEHRCRS